MKNILIVIMIIMPTICFADLDVGDDNQITVQHKIEPISYEGTKDNNSNLWEFRVRYFYISIYSDGVIRREERIIVVPSSEYNEFWNTWTGAGDLINLIRQRESIAVSVDEGLAEAQFMNIANQ